MRLYLAALLMLLPLTSGCLGVQDSFDASMIVHFYFEYTDDNEDTWDGPDQVRIILYDVSNGPREKLDQYSTKDFVLGDALHYTELGAGLYEISISGTDTSTGVTWQSDCTGLLLDRFDEIYGCDVLLEDPSSTGDAGVSMPATNQSDAGMP